MSATFFSPQTKESFDRDGFAHLPGFLSPSELTDLRAHLDGYVRDVVPEIPSADKFYEDKASTGTLKQLVRMNEHDDYFQNLLTSSKFAEMARLLLGGEVIPKGVEYFNKPPKIGRPTPPHQDGYYFMITPNEAVTFWVALEEVDAENGCLRYVRGSHQRGVRSHRRTDTLGFSQGISDYGTSDDTTNELAFNAHPGDVLVHHSLTIHRADGNKSASRTRQAIGLVYYSAAAREDKAAQKAYQEQLHQELAAAGKI